MLKLGSILVAALVVVPLLASPALANKNNAGSVTKRNTGAEGGVSHKDLCDMYRGLLAIAEAEADKRAGTAAAQPYSDQADIWWGAGVQHGCSWAA